MSLNTKIEWSDASWNPCRGCTKVSPGCKNCYARAFAERFRGTPGNAYERGFDPRLAPDKLLEPLKWTKPQRVFVNSMSDLFHDEFPDDYIVDCARVMSMAPHHTFHTLTKRPERMAELLNDQLRFTEQQPHIWWGVTVEDREHGVPRIDILRKAPAAHRFLSIEPLLGDLGEFDLTGISWVICGGESGRGARPILRNWVTSVRDQCEAAKVPFFFKQWGGPRKGMTGRFVMGRIHHEKPSWVQLPDRDPAEVSTFINEIEAKYELAEHGVTKD